MPEELRDDCLICQQTYLRFDGQTWPNPDDPTSVQHRLRYGNPSRSDLVVAASHMAAYRELVRASEIKRNSVVRRLREAFRGRSS